MEKKNIFKWWMSWHIGLWHIFCPCRVKMFHYGIAQGFGGASSYWSARCANREIVEWITDDKHQKL